MAIKIRTGYALSYEYPQPTPMILILSVHPSRRRDIITPDKMQITPTVDAIEYCDCFGNICYVIQAPAGKLTIASNFLVQDSGEPHDLAPSATQSSLETLPVQTLGYLLGSRYRETDRLEFAWSTFGKVPKGSRWFRRFATSCTSTSPSAMSTPTPSRPPTTPSKRNGGSVATSRILPSPYAAA